MSRCCVATVTYSSDSAYAFVVGLGRFHFLNFLFSSVTTVKHRFSFSFELLTCENLFLAMTLLFLEIFQF